MVSKEDQELEFYQNQKAEASNYKKRILALTKDIDVLLNLYLFILVDCKEIIAVFQKGGLAKT